MTNLHSNTIEAFTIFEMIMISNYGYFKADAYKNKSP